METTKVTTRLDPKLYKRVRILAVEKGLSLQALMTEALVEYLERAKKSERRRRK